MKKYHKGTVAQFYVNQFGNVDEIAAFIEKNSDFLKLTEDGENLNKTILALKEFDKPMSTPPKKRHGS